METTKDTTLTYKEKAFAEFWTSNGFIGWRAAKSAGYQGSRETLYVRASENLAKPHVKAYIESRLDNIVLDADQTIAEISSIAKGEVMQYVNEYGEFDIDALKENGLIRNLESITSSTTVSPKTGNITTKTSAKTANRRQALGDLLKVHDKIKPKTVIHVIGFNEALEEAYGDDEEVDE